MSLLRMVKVDSVGVVDGVVVTICRAQRCGQDVNASADVQEQQAQRRAFPVRQQRPPSHLKYGTNIYDAFVFLMIDLNKCYRLSPSGLIRVLLYKRSNGDCSRDWSSDRNLDFRAPQSCCSDPRSSPSAFYSRSGTDMQRFVSAISRSRAWTHGSFSLDLVLSRQVPAGNKHDTIWF